MPLSNTPQPIPRRERISVEELIRRIRQQLHIEIKPQAASGAASEKYITEADLHRPGLALAHYVDLFTHHRIQVIGNSETQFITHFDSLDKQKESFGHLTNFDIPVIILTNDNELPSELLEMAENAGIPVFSTPVETTKFMFLTRDLLEDQFAMQTMVHGSMVDVYGIGIMISGKSGIGKSEVALDLVERGHRLVADDVIMLTKKNNILMSSATETNKHFMEIRGLGVVDVFSMFGIRSIRYQKRLEVILELLEWDDHADVERTGLDHKYDYILDVELPIIQLPITPGKNITVIAEVIAMNHLLSHYGYDPAESFQEKIRERIKSKKADHPRIERAVDYYEGDLE